MFYICITGVWVTYMCETPKNTRYYICITYVLHMWHICYYIYYIDVFCTHISVAQYFSQAFKVFKVFLSSCPPPPLPFIIYQLLPYLHYLKHGKQGKCIPVAPHMSDCVRTLYHWASCSKTHHYPIQWPAGSLAWLPLVQSVHSCSH